MEGFAKIYASILDSSVWDEDSDTRLLWITMLAMASADGYVGASVGGLAHRARISREACDRALARLSGPDPDSRDGTDGQRITKVDRGWQIINHRVYREMRSEKQVAAAARVRRHRERQRNQDGVTCNNVTRGNAASASASDLNSENSNECANRDPVEHTTPEYIFIAELAQSAGWLGSPNASDKFKRALVRVVALAKETAAKKGTDWRTAADLIFSAWVREKPSRINLRLWPEHLAEDWHNTVRLVDGEP